MGNPNSKHSPDKDKKCDVSLMLSDKQEDIPFNELDPRSPNTDITRTPLQIHSPGKRVQQKITKQVDLSKKLSMLSILNKEEETPIETGSLLRKRLLESLDPRSPSTTIVRTPILLPPNSNEAVPSEEILDNSIMELTGKSKEIIEEKYADNLGTNEMNELVTTPLPKKSLLETNFDYLETDLDNFHSCETSPVISSESTDSCQAGYENNAIVLDETPPSVNTIETKMNELDPRSPTVEISRTPIILKEDDDFKQNVGPDNDISEDPRSPSDFIDRTPIVLPNDKMKSLSEVHQADVSDKDNESKQTNSSEMLLSNEVEVVHQIMQKNNKIRGERNNQIYEDKEHAKVTPRKTVTGGGNRTPLSCVKNKSGFHERSNSENISISERLTPKANTFIDNMKSAEKEFDGIAAEDDENKKAKPKFINKRTSKIPTLQKKSMENRVMNIAKNKLSNSPALKRNSNWDQDKSVLI